MIYELASSIVSTSSSSEDDQMYRSEINFMYHWSLILVKNSPLQSSIQSEKWIILSGFPDPSSKERWNTTLIVDVLKGPSSSNGIVKTSTGSLYVLKGKPDIPSFSNIPPRFTTTIKRQKTFPQDWRKSLVRELNYSSPTHATITTTSSGRVVQKPRKYWISSENSPTSFNSSPKRRWGNNLLL